MQQRFVFCRNVKVTGLLEQREIDGVCHGADHLGGQGLHFYRIHEHDSAHGGRDDRDVGGRKNADRPPEVEVRDREATGRDPARNDAGDQKARDDEEDVDTEVARLERSDGCMLEYHEQHREPAQRLNVVPKAWGTRLRGGLHIESM